MADRRWLRFGQLLGPLMGLIGVCALFAVLEPDSFLSIYNFQTIAAQTVIVGFGAIGATELRTEAVDRFLACWREPEYHSASGAVAGFGVPAARGRSIQISLLVEDDPCVGPVAVGAASFWAEVFEQSFLLSSCRT